MPALGIGIGLPFVGRAGLSPKSLFGGSDVGDWWDSSDLRTLFSSSGDNSDPVDTVGDAARRWVGKVNSNVLSEATNAPTWQGSAGVRFDGSNDLLSMASSLGLYAAGACSVFFALKGNPAIGNVLVGEWSSLSNNPRYEFGARATTDAKDAVVAIVNDANTSLLSNILSDDPFDNTKKVWGFIDTGSVVTGYTNGTAGTPRSYTRSGSMTVDRFGFGARVRAAQSNFFPVDVMEVIAIGRAVTSTERAAIESYLRGRWGI